MPHDDLDRILSREQEIAPSSGFVDGVMAAVQREAAAPPPIPFPWKRALPGIAVVLFVLVFLLASSIAVFTRGIPGWGPTVLPGTLTSILRAAENARFGWVLVALVVSYASVKLSALLALRRN